MNTKPNLTNHLCLFAVVCLLTCGLAISQNLQDNVTIKKSTVDGGGNTSETTLEGDVIILTGTIGQPDASTQVSADGTHLLSGGMWPGFGHTESDNDLIFKDGFEANN